MTVARQRFLTTLRCHGSSTALHDTSSGITLSYDVLLTEAGRRAELLPQEQKALVFCLCRNTIETVIDYIACLIGGHVIALLDQNLSQDLLAGLIDTYRPDVILSKGETVAAKRVSGTEPELVAFHPDLALLLPTSGTTGSPKFVRLSGANLLANAQSIIEYLGLTADERPVSSLPFHYSYGLSVLNSHLLCGATVVLTEESIMSPRFWQTFNLAECTSFAGVPYSYQILDRIGFLRKLPPSLRTMTQAGGRLGSEAVLKYSGALSAVGKRFFVMYGQTEATARIAYVPHNRLREKAGSIGIAIPGGTLSVVRDGVLVRDPNTEGEICYEGPNVMLGYATGRTDLSTGDTNEGRLMTGDLGYFDIDGFFYVTGRTKRISKVYGLRINLDEVESAAHALGPVAAVSDDQTIVLYHENTDIAPDDILGELSTRFKLNVNTFVFRRVDRLPLKANGKVDYSNLTT